MTTHLIIAEKPNMGREIASAFIKSNLAHSDPSKATMVSGDGFVTVGDITVTWAFGHLLQSFSPEDYNPEWGKWQLDNLPLVMEEWKVKVEPSKAKQFNMIRSLVNKHDIIYNAGDPGREGQLIVDEILNEINNKKPVKRLNLVSLKKAAVLKEFQTCSDNSKYYNLYQAAIARGIADWLVGFNASRLYTIKAQKKGYKGVLSVGRVQSPMLAIVVKRDLEIENFVPHKYFTIQAEFSANGTNFMTTWKPNPNTPVASLDKDKRLIDKNLFDTIVNSIKGKNGKVLDMVENSGKEYAPLPFNLSKLQIYANAKWGMSAQDVLDTCQALYEKHKIQTYPRTDCQYLPTDQFAQATDLLGKVSQYIPQLASAAQSANPSLKSAAWDDSQLSDHFGLIPTGKTVDWNSLNKKEQNIHQAVCERYIAQFHLPCEFNTSALTVECEKEIFKATGKVITKPGWKSIFKDIEEISVDKKTDDDDNQIFPKLNQGESVAHQKTKSDTKETKAPPRLTEGTLLAAATNIHTLVDDPKKKQILKNKKGIGQEATRASIIENFFKRNLLIKQGKSIISTSGARTLISALPQKIIAPDLTAIWEDALDQIAAGTLSLNDFKKMQVIFVKKLIDEGMVQDFELVVAPQNVTKQKICPTCGKGHLVEKIAKSSQKKFFACSTWPACNYVEWPKITGGKSSSSSSGTSKTKK